MDLCHAFLLNRNTCELNSIKTVIAKKHTSWSHFPDLIESLESWLKANRVRGCSFLNMMAEEPDSRRPLFRKGMNHCESLRNLIRKPAVEQVESDPQHYGKLDANAITDKYMVINGAVSRWPKFTIPPGP